MRSVVAFMIALMTLASPCWADRMELVGALTDANGTVLSVGKVELGRDQYVAVAIKEAGKTKDAHAILLLNEVSQARKYCSATVNSPLRPKPGAVEIIGSFSSPEDHLSFMVVNLEGKVLPIVQTSSDGQENSFVLTHTNQRQLALLLKKAGR